MPILIGRGLDLRKTKESVSLLVNSDLCSFEGAGRGARKAESARSGSEAHGKRKAPLRKVSGDDSWRAPPVPIPNTEVKPPNADGTELGTAWESRKLPGSTGSGRNGSFSRSRT